MWKKVHILKKLVKSIAYGVSSENKIVQEIFPGDL